MHPVLFVNSNYPLNFATYSTNLQQTLTSKLPTTLSSIPYPECVDFVFSGHFLDFLDKDRENPCLTAVGKTADKLAEFIGNFWNMLKIGWSEKIELENNNRVAKTSDDFIKHKTFRMKRDTVDTEASHNSPCFIYRKGPYFLHRPPFFNKDAKVSCMCKEISYQYPFITNKIKSSDFFMAWLTLGEGASCKMFKEQEKCLKSTLYKFFDPNNKFNNVLLLFTDNSTKLPLEPLYGQVSQPSEILPLNLTFSYWASKKLSPEFMNELSAEFKNFGACEKEAGETEKLINGGYTLAIALIISGLGIGVFKYFRKNPDIVLPKNQKNDLNLVTIDYQDYGTLKSYQEA